MKRLHIFRAGRHRAGTGQTLTFSEADLAGIARTYDPALHEAPLVVGHPRTDAPAYGWVQRVAADGAELQAEPHQVEATFAEMVDAGRFKKISAAFYLPDHPNHPVRKAGGEPEFPYLKHVGFLGAAAPAVAGLKPVEFAEDDASGAVAEFALDLSATWLARLARGFREFIISKFSVEEADKVIPSWMVDEMAQEAGRAQAATGAFAEAEAPLPAPDPAPDRTAEFAEREQQLADAMRQAQEREQQAAERERQLAEAERRQRLASYAAFAEALVQDNCRVLPADRVVVETLLDVVDQAEREAGRTVAFSEGDRAVEQPLGETVRAWLQRLPQQVEFAEVSRGTTARDEALDTAEARAARIAEYVETERGKGRMVSYAQALHELKAAR